MTLRDMLDTTVARLGDKTAILHKRDGAWQRVTYRDLHQRAREVAEALSRRGIRAGDRVALLEENSEEWPAVFFGIVGLGATAVPVDAKLREGEVAHILRDSASRVLCTTSKHLALVKAVEPELGDLEAVLVRGLDAGGAPGGRVAYADYDAELAAVREAARADECAYASVALQDTDLASFIYTSGTTGRQKGAMLTHGNFTSDVAACRKAMEIRESDNFLLVLPLHHSFAFTTTLLLPLAVGAQISVVESIRTVGDNLREVSATVVCGVPLLFEKMHGRIWQGLRANRLAHCLYRLGIRKPVVKGIADKLGGKLRYLISGGAPCDPEVILGFGKLGVAMVEGYGLTETAPVLTLNPPDRPKPGTVGRVLPGMEITILDANEQGVGEIAAKGPNIMKGYFNNPEATAEAFRDGWFLTGDLGFIDADGYLTITGRQKDLIVNREGKNIYPAEIEAAICRSPLVAEAVVVGYREAHEKVGERLGAIVVPDEEAFDRRAAESGKSFSAAEIESLVRDEVRRLCGELADYKRPRRVEVRSEAFVRTSTGKIKRYLCRLDAPAEG